jgi:hypothetical protein
MDTTLAFTDRVCLSPNSGVKADMPGKSAMGQERKSHPLRGPKFFPE